MIGLQARGGFAIGRSVLFRVAALACVVGALGYLGLARLWGGGGKYSLLTVTETNTMGLVAIPLEGDCPRAARLDEQARTLVPLKPEYAPDRRTKCLVVYDVDFAGVRVASEAFKVPSFPHSIEVGRPITVLAGASPSGAAMEEEALVSVPVPVCDNCLRLYAGELGLVGVSKDGTATLSLGGEVITVGPGQVWTAARMREGSSTGEARPGPDWAPRMKKAFDSGHPISKLTIINYGLWEKERVEQ